MKIDAVSGHQLRALFTPREAEQLGLFQEEKDSEQLSRNLARLLTEAAPQFASLPAQMLAEWFPEPEGGAVCYFTFFEPLPPEMTAFLSSGKAVPEKEKPAVFRFEGLEGAVRAACAFIQAGLLHRVRSSALFGIGGWYLLVLRPADPVDRLSVCCLEELGELLGEGELYAEMVLEHGRVILPDHALEILRHCLG